MSRVDCADLEVRFVEWIDSIGAGAGWIKLSEVKADARFATVQTVGFVISEDDGQVTLLQSLDDQDGDAQKADNYITVPKVAIKKSVVFTRPVN